MRQQEEQAARQEALKEQQKRQKAYEKEQRDEQRMRIKEAVAERRHQEDLTAMDKLRKQVARSANTHCRPDYAGGMRCLPMIPVPVK